MEPIPLEWRGRENGEGEMSFGDDCCGEITFLGNGQIKGSLNNLYGERCEFEGVKVEEGGTRRSAGSMRAEWDGYNDEAYEEERTGRWHLEAAGFWSEPVHQLWTVARHQFQPPKPPSFMS